MKRVLLLISLIACMQAVHAQYYRTDTGSHTGFDKSKLIFGGGLGLAFGDFTNVAVQPLIGYHFNRFVAAGVALNFLYSSDRYYGFDKNDNTVRLKDQYTAFGGGLWARFYPIPQAFIHVQPELNSVQYKSSIYDTGEQLGKGTYGVPSLLVGGGYSMGVGGGRSYISLMVLFDVLNRDYSPYGNGPIISPSINFGF
ncbi:hypothetical protein GA0116948_103318 [Chitinophaga costaii]|uniref:Outer membrane protein beta-barrel domain-containing protein n=1 Tax=Chitinophaga costaii TaxID=1335309 RepID=A0A1C4BZ03_9BACT|nr:hypothetical protein [Chitinophaga costaii]PUZ27415.1 hypothetical protein DCM91_04085 [Chitinophaga costaii]SCC12038.1 hypothetical protein GA0116948_103318 [Chitinophaga costaii]